MHHICKRNVAFVLYRACDLAATSAAFSLPWPCPRTERCALGPRPALPELLAARGPRPRSPGARLRLRRPPRPRCEMLHLFAGLGPSEGRSGSAARLPAFRLRTSSAGTSARQLRRALLLIKPNNLTPAFYNSLQVLYPVNPAISELCSPQPRCAQPLSLRSAPAGGPLCRARSGPLQPRSSPSQPRPGSGTRVGILLFFCRDESDVALFGSLTLSPCPSRLQQARSETFGSC